MSPFMSELKFSFESYSEFPYWRYNLWYDSWFNVIHLFIPRALPRGCLLRFSRLIFFHHLITNVVESPSGSYKCQTSTSDLISSSLLDVRWALTGWTSTNVANLWFWNQEYQRGMKDGCDWSSSFITFTVSYNLIVKYFTKQYFNASPTTLHLLIKLYIIHAKFTFFFFLEALMYVFWLAVKWEKSVFYFSFLHQFFTTCENMQYTHAHWVLRTSGEFFFARLL